MTLEDAIDRSILAYLDGEDFKEYNKADKPFKYTKKFFDDMDERVLPTDRQKKKTEEKKNG